MTQSNRPDNQDLQKWFAHYREERPDDVLVIEREVSPVEDATAVVAELEASRQSPVLYCSNVAGTPVGLLTNVFASRRRVLRLLGEDESTDLYGAYQHAASRAQPPVEINGQAVVGEVVMSGEDVSLTSLPLITHFSTDRGPYITSGVFVVDDPSTGVGNLSYHRSMVVGPTVLGSSLHSRGHLWRAVNAARSRAEPLPVAIVIGAHPLFLLAAAARVPADVDERDIAGGLLGEPLLVTRTPQYGIAVPATAEYVLEGEIDPEASTEEGPFGEFSGYSSDRSTNTVVNVSTIMQRHSPMLFDIAAGRSADHLNLGGIPREAEMTEKLKQRFPDVVAVHYPLSGVHFHAYVALRPSVAGAARQVMLGLLGWDPYLKTVIAVDDDIDPTSDDEVLWAVATRFQASEDLIVVDGLPGSLLDPSSAASGSTTRMGVDATRSPNFSAPSPVVSSAAIERARTLLDR